MTVSLIIPVYNGESYIHACLHSVLRQTYADWEAILIDDGSTDDSLAILHDYSKKDSRFIVVSQKNQGVAVARNSGIKQACGDYVAFLDIDDTLDPDCLNVFINQFEDDIDIVVGTFYMIKKGKKVKKLIKNEILGKVDYLKMVLSGKCGWELWAKMYRRELFNENISIPQHIRIGEDAAVYIQLVARSCKVKIINEAIYNYIQYPSSVSHRRSTGLAEETLQAAFYIDNLLKKEIFYQEIKDEIDIMFLLFYSNSTRKACLSLKHPLIFEIYHEHFSFENIRKLPLFKGLYVLLSILLKRIIS